MADLIQYLDENKAWLFSGAAFFVLNVAYRLFFKEKKKNQSIKTGRNSVNYIAGRDINN